MSRTVPIRMRLKSAGEKVWPTRAWACHNGVIWALGDELLASPRMVIEIGNPTAVIIVHRFDA
jgi:hypothetical protein